MSDTKSQPRPEIDVLRQRVSKLERELAERDSMNTAQEVAIRELVRVVQKVTSDRDQWREAAEELMNSAMDITDGIEWPPLDNALTKFRKLKEASRE